MSVADEIAKLQRLHLAGALSDAEFANAKARVLGMASQAPLTTVGVLRRSQRDRWFGGVCGGIGQMTGVESWVWRLLWVFLVLFAGVGLLAYVLCWIFVPDEAFVGQ